MLQSWPSGLSIFWTWWIKELKGLLIRKSAMRPPGHASYCEIHLGDGRLEVTDISRDKEGENRTPRGLVTPQDRNEPPAFLLARRNRPFVLSLPVEKCILYSAEVPKAALARIDQFLSLELSRVTPFSASEVLTGWYETAEGTSPTHTTVSQIVAKRALLAPALETLANWHIPIAGIFAKSSEGDYLPARLGNAEIMTGDRAVERWRKLASAACGVAAICAVIAAWNLFSRQAAELQELEQHIEIAQKKAVEVRKRLAQMESSSQRILDFKAAKLDGPSPLAIWEELTRLIPDTAWVSALAIDKAQVTIEGNAQLPEELIPLLDSSPLFEAVSFTAPVTKLPGNDLTRFVIRLSLSKTLQVSSAAP